MAYNSCRTYINSLSDNDDVRKSLERQHNEIFQKLIDSKLFNKWHDRWFLPPVGDGRYGQAHGLIKQLNQQYATPVVGTSYTKANNKEFVFVNVKNLLQKAQTEVKQFIKYGSFGSDKELYDAYRLGGLQSVRDIVKNRKEENKKYEKELKDLSKQADLLVRFEKLVNKEKKADDENNELIDIYKILLGSSIQDWSTHINQILLQQRLDQGELFQKPEIEQSKASPQTLEKVREFLKRIGVDIKQLDVKRWGNQNGVANLLQRTVEIGEGKENVALPEEAMHFAVAILKEENPGLYKKMYNKIQQYKLYNITKLTYQDDNGYKNPDGSPNIPKIKEEAIGKLLSEYYIKGEEGQNEIPDLLVQTKSWWQQFVDWIKGLIGKAGINPFEEAAKGVDTLKGEISSDELKGFAETAASNAKGFYKQSMEHFLRSGDYKAVTDAVYEQLSDPNTYWNAVDSFFDGDVKMADAMLDTYQAGQFKSIPEGDLFKKFDEQVEKYQLQKHEDRSDPNDENTSSYYTVVVDGKTRKTDRTTEWAKRMNLNKTGGKDWLANKSEAEKRQWARKAFEGTKGHYDLENLIEAALNEDGTIKPVNEVVLNTKPASNDGVYNQLKKYIYGTSTQLGFLYRFPEGTKIRTEQQIYNDKVKDNKYGIGRAGTLDVIAQLPDGRVEVYDWKFMGISEKSSDQPFMKRSQHSFQLSDYRNTLRQAYGVKDVKAFTIPIKAEYIEATIQGTKEKTPVLWAVTIGNTNFKDENRTYLLPVVPTDQSTGNEKIDTLVSQLRSHYQKLYERPVSEEERPSKLEDLNQLSGAIRNLQVRLNFEGLVAEAKNFRQLVKSVLDKYKDSKTRDALDDLNELYLSAKAYEDIDKAFISEYGTEGLEEKQISTLDDLRKASREAAESGEEILTKMKDILNSLSLEQTGNSILNAEKEVKGLASYVTEPSFIPNNSVKLFVKLLNTARSVQTQRANVRIKTMLSLIENAGPDAFEKITKKGEMELVDKYSREFVEGLSKAKDEKDKKFILDRIDKAKYDERVKEYIEKQDAKIKSREEANGYSANNTDNAREAKRQRENIRNSLYIDKPQFDGWRDKVFNRIMWSSLKEDGSLYSKEYNDVQADRKLADLYNSIEDLNVSAYNSGFLTGRGFRTFLPLVTGTMLERLEQSQNKWGAMSKALRDVYSIQENELQEYGKRDELTGEVKKLIPKFFTRTEHSYEELSKNLPRILSKYIEALEEYTTNQSLESIYLGLVKIEENKGHLAVDKNTGNVIFREGAPQVFQGNEVNTQFLQRIGEDAIYGLQEDTNTFIDKIASRLGKSEEGKEKIALSTKKILRQANSYLQMLAVGLKPLITASNYFGAHFQAMINSGIFYRKGEYWKAHGKTISSTLSEMERAIIDYFVPLNEEISKSARRRYLFKQSKRDWLATWSFKDVLMVSNTAPDRAHEISNALAWLDNTIVRDGKFENIRQWLRKGEFANKYEKALSGEKTVKMSEREFEKRVEELRKESLKNIAKFDSEGYLQIPGIDPETSNYGEYRTKILEFGRNVTSQMNRDNKARYRDSVILRSFAMFKNWIIRQAELRALDIHKNDLTDEWEYGRLRLYSKLIAKFGINSIKRIRDVQNATPEGLKALKDIIDEKRHSYYLKTGQELKITDDEFFDMVRNEISNETRELGILLSLMGMVMWAGAAAPPDDDDPLSKNRYKYMAKAMNKIADELRFYYNPLSFDSITRGSIFPSLGILTKVQKFMIALSRESWGAATGNEQMMDRSYPLKYLFDMIPFVSQFDSEVLPIIDPEMAKNLGIRLTSESRLIQ